MIKMMMNKMTDKKAIAGGKNKAGDGESSGFKEKAHNQMPGFSGNLYQCKWLIWYLLKGFSSQYKFELGTEVEDAGKYDDMVFKYKKVVDGDEKKYFIITQCKHRTNVDKKITYQDVFTDENVDLGLVKYFNSFVESKNTKLFKDGEIEHAIIYTNARFDMDGKIPEKDQNWKELGNIRNITDEMILKQDDILSAFKIKGGKFYKFKIDFVLPVLKSMILEYEYYKIARKLIECLKNKNKYLSLDDNILKHYNHLLLTEVIGKESKMFRDDFLNESCDDVENDTGRKKLRRALDKVLNEEELKIEEIARNAFKWRKGFEKFKQTTQIWPADILDDTDLIEFLKKFVFATEQPNETRLGKIILNELLKQYPLYDKELIHGYLSTKIQDWMKGGDFFIENIPKSKFISFEDVNKFFKDTIGKINKMVLKGQTFDHDCYIKDYDIKFVDSEFDSAIKAFLDSDQRILSILSKHTMISSIKLKNRIELEEFIFIKLSSSNKVLLNAAIEIFESESTDRLLVIEWDCDEIKIDDWSDKIKDIIDAIHNHDQKKLIIISNRHNILEKYFQNEFPMGTKCVERQDIANTLENLEKESQERFLNTMVKFQGTNAKLKDFIANDDLKKVIDADILQKILKKEDVNIGKSLEGLKGDQQHYYIKRTFMRKVENGEKVYLLIGINELDLYSNIHYFEIFDEFEFLTQNVIDIFEGVVNESKSKSVYLLKKKSNGLTLLRKSNDAFEESDFRNTMKCEDNKGEINLISGVAGTGKSTLFAKLSQNIKNQNPKLWVVKIDLNALSYKLNEIQNIKRNIQLETVIDLLHHGAKHQSELEKIIFEYQLRIKNVELLLDGFDEICPSYKFILLKMIRILVNETKIKTIWINTRPYDSIMNDMEENFANFYVKHYNFEPLTEDSQKEYLKNFWYQSIGVDNAFIELFIKELFKLLNNNMKGDFLGLPLHTMLIGFALKETFVKFKNSGTREISTEQRQKLSELVDLSSLYDKFVKFKCQVQSGDKGSLNLDKQAGINIFNRIYKKFLETNKILALDSLLDQNELKTLLTETELKQLIEYKLEIKERGDEFGIANRIVDKKPQFIHRTFAEYFVAIFFIENFKRKEKDSRKYVEYFLEKMINDENSVICDFIDSKLNDESNFIENNSDIYGNAVKKMNGGKLYFVLERRWQNIGEFLIKNGINMNCECNEKTILHSASKLKSLKHKKPILSLIFEKMNLKKYILKQELQKKEGDFDETPLLVAARYGIFENVKIIFEKCKAMEILNDILTDTNKYHENVIHVSVKCDNTFFLNLLNLLKCISSILDDLLDENNSKGDTPLIAAIKHGQQEKFKTLQNLTTELKNSTISDLFNKTDYDNNINSAVQNLHNDELFTYFSDLLISNPEKLKALLTKKDNNGLTPFDIVVCYGQRNKFETMWNLCGELDISIDSVLFNEPKGGVNMIYRASVGFCNDDFFNYLLDLLKSYPDKLKALLTKKANNGYTPLNATVFYDQRNKFEAMLNLCGELDISTDIVLFNESKGGENIINIASIGICNDDFFTYLLDLIKSNPDRLKALLMKKDNHGYIPFDTAVFYDQRNKFEAMWNLCGELDISTDIVLFNETKGGENIIHIASASNCNFDFFTYLLDLLKSNPEKLKALLTKKDNKDWTPFDAAVFNGYRNKFEAMWKLCEELDISTDSVLFNETGYVENIIHLAMNIKCNDDCFSYLLDLLKSEPNKLKALLTKKNNKGHTPFDVDKGQELKLIVLRNLWDELDNVSIK